MGQYHFDTWTTDNGLPQNGVRRIAQSPEGYLWFTTFDGLVRFDGVTFTTFNKSNTKGIINNRFTDIFIGDDGTMYATTTEEGVLTVYRNGEFTSYDDHVVPGRYIFSMEQGPNGEMRFLSENDDRKGRNWYRFVDGRFELIGPPAPPNSGRIIQGIHGATWRIDKESVTQTVDGKDTVYPIPLAHLSLDVNAFVDSSGALWLSERTVIRLKDGKVRTFSEADGLPENSYYHSFWEEKDGSVWFSSGGNSSISIGLVQMVGDQVIIWGSEFGLNCSMINKVFVDREGTPWLATDRGLVRRRKQIIESYSKADGIDHNEIYPLLKARDGTIWIGSTRGLTTYRDGRFEALLLTSAPGTEPKAQWRNGRAFVQSLWEAPDGSIWVGLSGGIYVVRDKVASVIYEGAHVYAIDGDQNGNVWAATSRGIYRFEGEKVASHYTFADGLPSENVTTIFRDSKGTLWFGSFGGLSRFEDGRFTNLTVDDGLAGNYVRSIYEDAEGTLWIGTYDQGMSRYKDGKFFSYNIQNGLYNNGVFAIREDGRGDLWISSNRGIYRVNRRELNDLADGRIGKVNSIGYGKEDGMLSTECNGGRQPASLVDDAGRFWFPTQDGVAIVDPQAETSNPFPPTVIVENIYADREAVPFGAGADLRPGINSLEIKYTGVSLIKSSQIKFQYMLEGRDTDWVDAGTRRTAYYTYLPPGEYTFRVRAANSDGVWNEKGTAVKLTAIPYFYQTRTFALVVVGVSALVLLLIWKISIYQLKARERKLTRLVEERTAKLAEANRVLQDLANSDGLTMVGNRRRFESFLTDEWHRAVRFKTPISLLLLDIDHFKLYNDGYGHQTGDECLQVVAGAMRAVVKRPTDLVARFGGEEFAIVLGGTDAAGGRIIAEQVVHAIRSLSLPHRFSPTSSVLTVSVGIATMLPSLDDSQIGLVRDADRALYKAKADGRDRIEQKGTTAFDDIPVPLIISDQPGSHAN